MYGVPSIRKREYEKKQRLFCKTRQKFFIIDMYTQLLSWLELGTKEYSYSHSAIKVSIGNLTTSNSYARLLLWFFFKKYQNFSI